MGRSYGHQDLVALPRLSAQQALTLLTMILTVFSKHAKLSKRLERVRTKLTEAHAALASVLLPGKRPAETSGAARRKADIAIDAAWSAFFDWLSGWCKLEGDENPNRPKAQALLRQIFSDGLGFTKFEFNVEWSESKVRLDALAKDGNEELIKSLGGAPFLKRLRATHKQYGDALGITAPAAAEASAPDIRAKLEGAVAALRYYAVQVVSHADPDDSGSEALSEELLAPLLGWESSKATVADGEGSAEGDAAGTTDDAGKGEPTAGGGAG